MVSASIVGGTFSHSHEWSRVHLRGVKGSDLILDARFQQTNMTNPHLMYLTSRQITEAIVLSEVSKLTNLKRQPNELVVDYVQRAIQTGEIEQSHLQQLIEKSLETNVYFTHHLMF